MDVQKQNGDYYNELKKRLEDFFCELIIFEANMANKDVSINETAKEAIRAYGGSYFILFSEIKDLISHSNHNSIVIDRKSIFSLNCYLNEFAENDSSPKRKYSNRDVWEYLEKLNEAVVRAVNQKRKEQTRLRKTGDEHFTVRMNITLEDVCVYMRITAAAITDRLKRYDATVRELLAENPDNWRAARTYLASVRKRDMVQWI